MSDLERGSRLGAKEAAVGLGLFGASAGLVFLTARTIRDLLSVNNTSGVVNTLKQGVNELHDLNNNLAGIRAQLAEINKRVPQGGVEDLIEVMGDAATVVGAFTGRNIIRPNRIEELRKRSQ